MGAAVAAILIKERHIVEAFEMAGATAPDRARLPSDLNVHEGGVGWRRLRGRAVVRESREGSGEFYVDLLTWQALRHTRRRLIIVLLLTVLALAVLLAVIPPASR